MGCVRRVGVLDVECITSTRENQGEDAHDLRDPLLHAHRGRLLKRSVRGSEVDLHEARERPEVRIREAVPPERERVARQAGDFRIVPGVLREGEQVAPDCPHPQAVDPETKLLHQAPGEGVADVQLLDLHVRPVLDEEVDRVDAVVESPVISARLFPGTVRAVRRVRRPRAVHRRLPRLIVDPVYESGAKRPLPRPVVDVPALHPIHQRVGGETLVPHVRRKARVEVGVHVANLDDLVPRGIHVGEESLVGGVVRASRHHVPVFVNCVVGGGIGQARGRANYTVNEDGYVVATSTYHTANEAFLTLDPTGNKIVKIGDVNPDFNASFTTNVRYKGFSAYALVDWVQGGNIYNGTRQWAFGTGLVDRIYDQSGKPAVNCTGSPDPTHCPYSTGKKSSAYYGALYNGINPIGFFVENGTYVKIKELNVS